MDWLSLVPLGGIAALAMVYFKHREIQLKEREVQLKERDRPPLRSKRPRRRRRKLESADRDSAP